MVQQRELKTFLSLPVNREETWQGGVVSVAEVFGAVPDDARDAHLVLWRSASTELVHARPVTLAGANRLNEFLNVMLELGRNYDFPFCPARIECNDRELADGLGQRLRGSGTTVRFVTEMREWNAVLEEVTEHLGSAGPPIGSLIDAGCTERQVRAFAHAASSFYRARLWDHLDDIDLIKVEAPPPPRGLKYAVVLGAGTQTYGLGFYDDPEDHFTLMTREADPRELTLGSVTFDNPSDVNSADIAFWHEWDLPLETGDAFPSMNFFSQDGPRRPNPRELDFATLLLNALADTSEDDIDSGRWTKAVHSGGKSKKVVFSIPNLLDPPDRQEWMRRGMMPDRRAHEGHMKLVHEFIQQHAGTMSLDELNAEINARFTGPIDELLMPTDTPQQRAESLCQQAIESFGRRRIQLARQALAEDPMHVEANLLLAEAMRATEQRIERFRQAKQMAQQQLGPLMEEAGHFWGIHQTRPFMRACQGLAEALREAGQTGEAIEQYQEMLRLNPGDNQGVRYELAPLLVTQNRDTEAIKLLDDYRESTAMWNYMKSLVAFRRSGPSAEAKKALRAAFRANEHVVQLLQSDQPPRLPDSYALGSPEEAAVCIQEQGEAWDETDGYLQWMLSEYFRWEQEKTKRRRDAKRRQRKKGTKSKRRR